RLLVLGTSGAAELRDPADGRLVRRLTEPKAEQGPGDRVFAWARAAVVRPDGKRIAYLGHPYQRPGVIVLADPADGRTVHLLKGHTAPVTCLAWTPDGSRLLSGGHDRAVKVWDGAGRERAALAGHRLPVAALAVGSLDFAVTAGAPTQFG